ncbi:hypothetical protein D3C72_842960 [compost metagenome]
MEIVKQIEMAQSRKKLNEILIEKVLRLCETLENRLRFSVPVNQVEMVALAGLAKGLGTTESVLLLAKNDYLADAAILSRVLMEVACRISWMLQVDELQEQRLLMLTYLSARASKRQVAQLMNDDEIDTDFAPHVPTLDAEIADLRSRLTAYHDLKFDKIGDFEPKLTFMRMVVDLDLKHLYPLVYSTLSGPAHADIGSLYVHLRDAGPKARFMKHPISPRYTNAVFNAHVFLTMLAGNVDLNLTTKLDRHFQDWMAEELIISYAFSKRWSALLDLQG